MYPLCWPIDKASRYGLRLSNPTPSLPPLLLPWLTVCPHTSLCVGQLYLRANDKSVKKIRKNGEKGEKEEKGGRKKKRRQKFLRPFFINSSDGDGDGWSRRRQQTQGYVARVVMATQLTRHFTCRIRVLAAIFALIALYFAFREPSLMRARDQPDEQPYPLPL